MFNLRLILVFTLFCFVLGCAGLQVSNPQHQVTGYVLYVEDDFILMDLGKEHLKNGQLIHIFTVHKTVTHPVTNKLASVGLEPLGTAVIRQVGADSSSGTITDRSGEIAKGCFIRKVVKKNVPKQPWWEEANRWRGDSSKAYLDNVSNRNEVSRLQKEVEALRGQLGNTILKQEDKLVEQSEDPIHVVPQNPVIRENRAATIIRVPEHRATIQAGINAAVNGNIVLVANGTYKGKGNVNLDFKGKAITVKSEGGAEKCIIDCQSTESTRGFNFHSKETQLSVLDGFTIKNGKVDTFAGGGGILCSNSSPVISNCILLGNTASPPGENSGGGLACFGSSPIIDSCTISNNYSSGWGGGICCDSNSFPSISNCIITNNESPRGGGIVFYRSSHPNRVPTITNCIISDNQSSTRAGGMEVWESSPKIVNCVIANNSGRIGGVFCGIGASPIIINTILWGNNPQEISSRSKKEIIISYSNVKGGKSRVSSPVNWGAGNIDTDPLFVDAKSGDYRLSDSSPCIGVGILTDDTPKTDIEGGLRPSPTGSHPDIGAYEKF